jgi:hypothetical protein
MAQVQLTRYIDIFRKYAVRRRNGRGGNNSDGGTCSTGSADVRNNPGTPAEALH